MTVGVKAVGAAAELLTVAIPGPAHPKVCVPVPPEVVVLTVNVPPEHMEEGVAVNVIDGCGYTVIALTALLGQAPPEPFVPVMFATVGVTIPVGL